MRALVFALALFASSAKAATVRYDFEAANGYAGSFVFDTESALWSLDLSSPYGHFTDLPSADMPTASFALPMDVLSAVQIGSPTNFETRLVYGPVLAQVRIPESFPPDLLVITFFSLIDENGRDYTQCPVALVTCPISAFPYRDSGTTFSLITSLEIVPEPGALGVIAIASLALIRPPTRERPDQRSQSPHRENVAR
jgi:hypothetical protein